VIVKTCHVPFEDKLPRITVLAPRARNLVKLASVMPEVESFASRIESEDGFHWLHVIALTASEYYGQNRNGDHWSIEGLSYLPPGWSNDPAIDRELAKDVKYGSGTFYGAYAFPHHTNKNPADAIGRVELVVWNPKQFWVELIIRLDRARTAQSRVKWVLDRIARNAPFDVSMGAKVPFDMATFGDIKTYRDAWRMYDPWRHRSPADAVLEEYKRCKAVDGVGIYGLSVTRDDYLPELKTEMGKILPNGVQRGVRNDFAAFFDISIVYVGADKVAKYIAKYANLMSVREAILRQDPTACRIDHSYRFFKAAAAKQADVRKKGDIDKVVEPAFDEKSFNLLVANDPDLPEPLMRFLADHPNLDRVLSTLTGLGVVLKPKEFEIVSGGREAPLIDHRLFTPEIASRLLGIIRKRSALGPAVDRRMADAGNLPPREVPIGGDENYQRYRLQITAMLNGGHEDIFRRNPDLWFSVGRAGRVPLVSDATRRYFGTAWLPPVSTGT